jgi:hypothetical protein
MERNKRELFKQAEFHPAYVADPVDKRVERNRSVIDALDEVEQELKQNPNDPEIRRQAELLRRQISEAKKKLDEMLDN